MSARSQAEIQRTARRLAVGAAALATLVGALALGGGWGLDLALLRSTGRGLPQMEPNDALALLLLGVGLWLRAPPEASRWRQWLGGACAALVTLLGLATLAQYALEVDLGVDRLLFAEQTRALRAAVDFPGRSAPNAATCFVLLGLALLLLERRARPHLPWADLLVLPALFIALVAFNGYLYGALTLADLPQFAHATGMSLPASLGVLVLGTGLLCARPSQGVVARLSSDTLGGFTARLLLPLLLVGPPLVGVVLELLHTLEVLSSREEIALFSTAASTTALAIVLFLARVLDRIDAERRQAIAALEASGARLLGLLDAEPDPVVAVDRQGVLRFVSVRVRDVFGYPREELVGQPVTRLLPEHSRYTQLLQPGMPPPEGPLELHGQRRDGTLVPLEVTFSPFESPEGWVLIGLLRDITARRELERLKEEYVGLISHDLRSPLHTISLRLDLLLRQLRARELGKETAAAEVIQQSVRRMGGMINELLEGTRLESGRVELRREPLELGPFLAEVLERDVPPGERERFQLECPAALPPVLADAPRVARVVVNLLTNALKYAPEGSPVAVRLACQEGQAVVSVQDQGPGLAPEDAQRLFQKYYRTRAGTEKTDGLGLGLYISRLIIEAHGGRIWVESTPGQGATFSFTLPLALPREAGRPAAPGST